MKPVYLLMVAIGAAVAVAAVKGAAPGAAEASTVAVSERPPLPTAPVSEPDHGGGVDGEVLEVIQVPSYSYLRVGAKGEEGTWTAVSTAKIKVGDTVHVRDATRMVDFKSTSLGRTFPVIFFGALAADGAPSAPGMKSPHGSAGPNPHANSARLGADGADPHAGASKGDAVPVAPVARAKGPNAATVAEVNQRRAELNGKTVKVHGTVVKANAGILGKTFLHLRDGSGDTAAQTNDLAVTTTATPAVGDTVTIEGVVVLDLDIGSGYKFRTIVQDAALATP